MNDLVYLNAPLIRPQSGINKLNPVNRGPFKIVKQINDVTFALELPKNWKIKNAFHVSRLKGAKENDSTKFPLRKNEPPPEPEIEKDGTVEYEVDRIVDRLTRYNRI